MRPPEHLPIDVRQVVEALQAEKARLENTVLRQDRIIQLQDEKIRLLNFQLWGPKGEKLSPALSGDGQNQPVRVESKPASLRG